MYVGERPVAPAVRSNFVAGIQLARAHGAPPPLPAYPSRLASDASLSGRQPISDGPAMTQSVMTQSVMTQL